MFKKLLFLVSFSILFSGFMLLGCNKPQNYPDYSGMYRCFQNYHYLDTLVVEDTCLVSLLRNVDQKIYTVGIYSNRFGTQFFNAKMNYQSGSFTYDNSQPIGTDSWYGYLLPGDSLTMTHKTGHLGIAVMDYYGKKIN